MTRPRPPSPTRYRDAAANARKREIAQTSDVARTRRAKVERARSLRSKSEGSPRALAAEPKPEAASAAFPAELDSAKSASTLQLLFKAARLLDERALRRVPSPPGSPRLRRSHTSLLPHLDLQGTRLTDLAERMGISKQAVSQLVDDLEALGVLARTPDPEDARAKRVVFTDFGRQSLLQGLATLRELEQELIGAVGARPMEELRRALVAILASLKAEDL